MLSNIMIAVLIKYICILKCATSQMIASKFDTLLYFSRMKYAQLGKKMGQMQNSMVSISKD